MFEKFYEITNGTVTKAVKRGGSYNGALLGKDMPDSEYQALGLYGVIENFPVPTQYQRTGVSIQIIDDVNMTVTDTIELLDFTPAEIAQAKQKEFSMFIQNYLDTQAQTKGYDSILSACSYAGHTNPFQAEGQAFVSWRGNVWAYSYQALADVQAGTRTEPTLDEFLLELQANVPLVLP